MNQRDLDLAREQDALRRARLAASELLDAAAELGWYTADPAGQAAGHVEAVLRERGLVTTEPPIAAERRRRPLPSRAVWDRDEWTCRACGTHTNLTVDHIMPWSLGGSDDMDNLQTLCGSCNSSKGARV